MKQQYIHQLSIISVFQFASNLLHYNALPLYHFIMNKRYLEKTLSEDEQTRIRKNGRTKVKYFNKVYVMATAAAKMLSHAHFG